MSIEKLVELSRFYGSNPEYILAGGGNTSWKDNDSLFVKASGFSLAEATVDSFVEMDRKALLGILLKTYPDSTSGDPFASRRESVVLANMIAARKEREEEKRPSVEVLLHEIMPFSFVVHLHPAMVNGLTCSLWGEKAAVEIFGEKTLWIPSINPGYMLSVAVKKAQDEYYIKYKKQAAIIFLQNHGVFVGDEKAEGVKELYGEIMSQINAMIKWKPDFSDEKRDDAAALSGDLRQMSEVLRELSADAKTEDKAALNMVFFTGKEISEFLKNRVSFIPVSSAFTPDHIVYAGSDPLFIEDHSAEGIRRDWEAHVLKTGRNPKIIAVQGVGVFAVAKTEKAANFALDLFKDSVKIAVYTENFGGPLFMTREKIEFINNWEVERFRSDISTK